MKVMRLLSSLHHDEDERNVFLLCRTLIKQGHESLVLASTDPHHELAERLVRDGSDYVQLYLEKDAWLTWISILPLAKMIRDYRPDIIHVHSRTPAWILKWALQFFVPAAYHPITIATIYGYYPVSAYNKAIFDVDYLISVSDSVSEHIKEHHLGFEDDEIKRIYRGVDIQKYIYRHHPSVYWLRQIFAEFPELEHKRWLLFPSRIGYDKGQQWLFDIVGNLKSDYPDIHVLIMDDDNSENMYMEEFIQRMHALGLASFFTFIGQRKDDREWLSAANVVLGLANQPESIGMNLLKAIHLGTPVVAWNRGIYSELLQDLYPQGLVKIFTAIALCKAVKVQLKGISRPQMTNRYTAKDTVCQIINFYQTVLASEASFTPTKKSAPENYSL